MAHRQKLVRQFVAASCLTVICRSVIADIPPPPPVFPGIGLPVPSAAALLICGLLISVGIAWGGRTWVHRRQSDRLPTSLLLAIAAVVAVTAVGTVYAWSEHQAYEDVRKNWQPNGPVEKRIRHEQLPEATPPEHAEKQEDSEIRSE